MAKLSSGLGPEKAVGQFENNQTSLIVGRLTTVNGDPRADLRVYFANLRGKLIPTKKGLSVRLVKLPELRKLVDDLCRAAGVDKG